jgi:ribosomal protein L11 methyltransferase
MKSKGLWQISVTTSREAEEAVAALLERLFGVSASIYTDEDKQTSVATVYTPEKAGQVLSKREALKAGLGFLSGCQLDLGSVKVTIKKVARDDWAQSWKKYFKTIEIGSELLICPSWSRRRPRPGQAAVTLDPGLSFGTGQHPTTAFCLRQLVGSRKTGQVQSLLDIGSGSGILAIAATKLGYKPVRAIDFDPTAVRVAHGNARRNRVQQNLKISRADLRRIPLKSKVKYDLICANLVDELLISQARRILNRLRPGGRLVLAGILARQFGPVKSAYQRLGMRLAASRTQNGWQSAAFVEKG